MAWLHCVGCGNPVVKDESGMLAISCGSCGAYSPILHQGLKFPVLPGSLVSAMAGKDPTPPHLEYYLGYSGHQSRIKTMIVAVLIKLGCTSQRECKETKCREIYEKERTRSLESKSQTPDRN